MSKRGASDYITKENGTVPNDASEEKVKMANAAQMARRKIAAPKSRLNRSTSSATPSATSSNPFSSSTFGAPPSNNSVFGNTNGSVTFGENKSFPPGAAASGSEFSFAVPGGSSSFTFGQPASSNPFAGLNGGPTEPSTSSVDNDAMMESPQKKQNMSTSTFAMNGQGAGSGSGFSFGQPAQQSSGFSFGQTQSNGGFGSGTSLFGQSVSRPEDSEPASTSSLFGQISRPQEKSAGEGALSNNLFGQPASSQPTFAFGQTESAAQTQTPSFSFGQSKSQPASTGFQFGQPSPSSQPAFTTPASSALTTSVFGTAKPSTSNNLFAGFGSTAPVEASQSPEPGLSSASSPVPSTNFFAPPASEKTNANTEPKATNGQAPAPASTPANEFVGIFGQSTKDPTPASNENSKPMFSFAAPSQPSGLFSAPKTNESSKPAESANKPLFSFGSSQTPKENNASVFKPSAATTSTSSSLFGDLSKKHERPVESVTSRAEGIERAQEKPISSPSLFSSGQITSNATAATSNNSMNNFFAGFGQPQPSAPASAPTQNTSPELNKPKQTSSAPEKSTSHSFAGITTKLDSQSKSTSDPPPSKNMNMSTSDAMTTAPAPPALENPKRIVNTNPPTRIPPYLDGEEYKAYDSNYRLHSLNREFQKHISALDASRHDFENIVRNYVAARESIGESIRLYARSIAGMKRKGDNLDDDREGDVQSKKTKQSDGHPAQTSPAKDRFASSIFQPVPSSSTTSKSNTFNLGSSTSSAKAPAPNSSTSSLFKSMIPEANTASNTNSSSAFFSNAGTASSSTAPSTTPSASAFSFGKKSTTTPPSSPPKKATFEMPKFNTSGASFTSAFAKSSEASTASLRKTEMEKRKAEDFDSDEEDEETWTKKYEAEEKAKLAKLEGVIAKGFVPSFAPSSTASTKPATFTPFASSAPSSGFFSFGNKINNDAGATSDEPIDISGEDGGDDETEESGESPEAEEVADDDLPEDEVSEEDAETESDGNDAQSAADRARNQGKSLFERIEPNPALKHTDPPTGNKAKPQPKEASKQPMFGGQIEKSTPEAPGFSPLTPAGSSKEPYVPAKTFNFTPTPSANASASVAGASIFAGGLLKDGPISGEGLFGSRPSTPLNGEQPRANVFGSFGTSQSGTSAGDQTWKRGSEIKFGSSETEKDAPSFSLTAPSPQKPTSNPFGGLFGNGPSSSTSAGSGHSGFSFGGANGGSMPGFLGAASHLVPGSGTNSGVSSRATSPGGTDNESVATNEGEDFSNDPQTSLMTARPGEENEDIMFEARAKGMKLYSKEATEGTKLTPGWNSVGVGPLRILKHRETGKTRIVLRAEPGANIILNTNLIPSIKYESVASGAAKNGQPPGGAVKFGVFTTATTMENWLLKVKSKNISDDMSKVMEDNKGKA